MHAELSGFETPNEVEILAARSRGKNLVLSSIRARGLGSGVLGFRWPEGWPEGVTESQEVCGRGLVGTRGVG
jgi:hypothetical protein